MKSVVDVTYSIDGKNYTDAVDIAASVFPTSKPGALTLVATDKEAVVRELHATLKTSENYLKEAEREVPKQEGRVKECRELIAQLDTEYKDKQQLEQRFGKIEETQKDQGSKLDKILNLLQAGRTATI
jgi:DNA repair exonuclease SbcCD ATPase subunit